MWFMDAVPADDVRRRRGVISDERGERTKKKNELDVQNKDLSRKNVGGFRYKPRGDLFPLLK